MMTTRMVVEYVTAEPFRIKMASGQSFDVRHPEKILVGRTSVRVFTTSEAGDENGEGWQDVSLMLMETIEPMSASLDTAEG